MGVLGAKDYLKNSGHVQPLPFVHSRAGGCNFKIAIPHPILEFLKSIGLGFLPSKTKKLKESKLNFRNFVLKKKKPFFISNKHTQITKPLPS